MAINKLEIVKEVINDGGSATFGFIQAVVSETMKQKIVSESGEKDMNPLWEFKDKITKRVNYQVLLNSTYSKRVNAQRVREGKEANFEAKSNWHVKYLDGVNGTISIHKDDIDKPAGKRFYLLIDVQRADTLEYYIDGRKATEKEVQTIKKFKQGSSAKNQGLDKEVIVRSIALDNITEIRCNKISIEFSK